MGAVQKTGGTPGPSVISIPRYPITSFLVVSCISHATLSILTIVLIKPEPPCYPNFDMLQPFQFQLCSAERSTIHFFYLLRTRDTIGWTVVKTGIILGETRGSFILLSFLQYIPAHSSFIPQRDASRWSTNERPSARQQRASRVRRQQPYASYQLLVSSVTGLGRVTVVRIAITIGNADFH